MKLSVLTFIFIMLVFTGCYIDDGPAEFPAGQVIGYQPVYASDDEFEIAFVGNQQVENPGKIYSYQQYLLVNDQLKGVHVFDNSNPSDPKSLGFIRIIGNVDIAIRGYILYADQLNDLVAIDISDIKNPVELDRVKYVYTDNAQLPPRDNNYFECVDKTKAHLLQGWKLTQLNNPQCFR